METGECFESLASFVKQSPDLMKEITTYRYYICIYVYVYVFVYTYVYVCIFIYIHIYRLSHSRPISPRTWQHMHTFTCMYMCIWNLYIYICIYVHVYTYTNIYICMYIHIFKCRLYSYQHVYLLWKYMYTPRIRRLRSERDLSMCMFLFT